jgi:hypothetical protein
MDKIIQKTELTVSRMHRIIWLFVFFFSFSPRPTQNPKTIIYSKKFEKKNQKNIGRSPKSGGKKKKKNNLCSFTSTPHSFLQYP